eukprot:scaffold1019_cov97-Skeletonema_marinoi.AAC.16
MERAIAMAEDGVNTGSVSETVAWRNKWIASEWGDQIVGEYTKEFMDEWPPQSRTSWVMKRWRRSLTLKTFLTLNLIKRVRFCSLIR